MKHCVSHYGDELYIYPVVILRASISKDLVFGLKVEILCPYSIILRGTRKKWKGKGFAKNQEKQTDRNLTEEEEPG